AGWGAHSRTRPQCYPQFLWISTGTAVKQAIPGYPAWGRRRPRVLAMRWPPAARMSAGAFPRCRPVGFAGMVDGLDVAFEVVAVEVHRAQVALEVAFGLVGEMRGVGMAALAAGADGPRLHFGCEFDGGDEAVAAVAVVPLGAVP